MNRSIYIRNIVFGVEDSLVSTVGLLSGIDIGHVPNSTILFTGIVFIAVEAFSMAVGSFLSEESVQEYEEKDNGRGEGSAPASSIDNVRTLSITAKRHMVPAVGAVIMFGSFVIAGFVPLVPYLFTSGSFPLTVSIIISLIALGVLGYASARVTKVSPWKRTFRMIVLGGSAIIIGALVSYFVRGV